MGAVRWWAVRPCVEVVVVIAHEQFRFTVRSVSLIGVCLVGGFCCCTDGLARGNGHSAWLRSWLEVGTAWLRSGAWDALTCVGLARKQKHVACSWFEETCELSAATSCDEGALHGSCDVRRYVHGSV